MKKKQFYQTKAWKVFSKYVKLMHSKDGRFGFCFTCNKIIDITSKNCHAGHYHKVFDGNQTNFAVAFDERNVGIQCYQCNRFGGGKQDVMRQRLIDIWGENSIKKLDIKKRNWCKLDKSTLKIIAEDIEKKFKALKNKKGNPWN